MAEGNLVVAGSDKRGTIYGINLPLISHEIGQYSVYPSMKEISKYTLPAYRRIIIKTK